MLDINPPRFNQEEIDLFKKIIKEFVMFRLNFVEGTNDREIDVGIDNFMKDTFMVEIIKNIAYETKKYNRQETYIGYGDCEKKEFYKLINLTKKSGETRVSKADFKEFKRLNEIIENLVHIARNKSINHTPNFTDFLTKYNNDKLLKDYSSVSNFLDYLSKHDDIKFLKDYIEHLDKLRVELNTIRDILKMHVLYCFFDLPEGYDEDVVSVK